ncbi:MAG: signal recognition particle receptor subunit alpha [Candidatus Aenigmarchaeota archaeon]|nr:signal recognition particle receptor subunit alpha [Candidatus Aenigmarchaeota archaeon]
MVLDTLGKGLSGIIRRLITGVSIDKKAVEEILSDLKKVLLESDVELKLTEDLVKKIRKKCLEEKIPAGLTLREHVLKVIYEELVRVLGEKPGSLLGKKRIMFVGLFGTGKTTSVIKLARYLQRQGLKPAIAGLDYHRPAAVEQLIQLSKQIHAPVYWNENNDPYEGAKVALERFRNYDTIIFDTAGRDALDKELADELRRLAEIIKPDEVLLTIPADIGKVAGPQGSEFNKLVEITGVIVTRLDGTAKGGGALTSCATTGAKVKFIGIGEKLEDFEEYNPERFVSRLLGLGDLQTLLEKAKESEIKPEKVEKVIEGKLTLQDFYEQLKAMQKMGPLQQIASMIPGFGTLKLPQELLEKQEEKMKKFAVIIQSMTKEERENPEIINASRIKRCARGSGTKEAEVRELLAQYNQMKKLLKSMGGIKGLQRGKLKDLAKSLGFGF